VLEEQSLHEIAKAPDGKIIDRMSDGIGKAITDLLTRYVPEDSQIKAPALAFFALPKGINTISDEWMSEEQKADILKHVETRENLWTRESIELFRHNVPLARIVEIPGGHHYCSI